jgi:Bifunctional DNA primase/polymerase, N-terminal/Primase C terminal 1 (PriCT-1)
MLRTALALAKRKLHVFPCLPRGKEPAVAGGFKAATTDPQIIQQWWCARPDCNVAIATGAISGVFVVDVDDLDGELELRRLEAEHGTLPPTVEVITGGGRHLYFKTPEAPVRNSASKVADNIDVRGDGGYVLAPPSIHPSGRRYAWSADSASVFAAAPDWLLAKISKPTNGNVPTPLAEWRDLVLGGVGEGQRNHTVTRLAGYLLRRHVDPLVALEFLTAWNATRCQPPLEAAEVARIVDSIAGRELKRRGAE